MAVVVPERLALGEDGISSAIPAARTRPWLPWVLAVSAALVLGLIETGQLAARSAGIGRPLSLSGSLWSALPRWLLLAPLAVGTVAVCRRYPLEAGIWVRRLPWHLVASVVFCLLHLAACVVVYGLLIEGVPNRFAFRLQSLLTIYFVLDVFIYWSIVGAWSAFYHARIARERALASERLRASVTEARLDALRAQLHPHFLFNALNATSTMALRGDGHAVARMIERLSTLLRASIDPDLPREVPLARELQLLQPYLDIQLVRFEGRLSVLREIDPEALAAPVPPLLLQPLVENAIEHGVAARPGAAIVRIRASLQDGALRVEVQDDGPGWEPALPRGGDLASAGVGLRNTVARLECLYGASARLERLRSPEGGATARVVLPVASGRLA